MLSIPDFFWEKWLPAGHFFNNAKKICMGKFICICIVHRLRNAPNFTALFLTQSFSIGTISYWQSFSEAMGEIETD